MTDATNPTVTLNADVSPYVQGMQQAAAATQQASTAIDVLTQKAKEIRQQAANGFQIIGAGTLTGLTSLALVSANADRQMSTLAATAKITGGNLGLMTTAVNKMTRDMPITRAEIVQLTTALSKMGLASETQVSNFSNLFSRMGAATGENSMGLASQVIQLSRQMGNLNTASVDKLANSLTKVSAAAGVSATETAQFANSIAPFARAAGIGQEALTGISAAFTKAGADGFAAANTFNQMMSDITRLTQQGSPALNKYAAAIGVTLDQFKMMDPAEQFVRIVETLQKAGPDAGKILERLGYDGIRASRALQTVAGNAGDLRKAIGLSAEGEGAIDQGSQAAMGGLLDNISRLRNSTENLAINFGDPLVRPMNVVVSTFTNFLGVVGSATEVLRPFLGLIAALGTGLLALGTAMKFATIASTINLAQSVIKGPVAAFRSGQRYGRTGSIEGTDPNWLARRNLANDDPNRLNFVQRGLVDAGLGFGRAQTDLMGEPDPRRRGILNRSLMGASNLTYNLLDTTRQFYADANIPGYDRRSYILKPMEDAINRRLAGGNSLAGGEQGSSGIWGSALRAATTNPMQFFRGVRAGNDLYGATADQVKGLSERALNQEQFDRTTKTLGARRQFSDLTPEQQQEVLRRTKLMERSDRSVDAFRKTMDEVAQETRRKTIPGMRSLSAESDKAGQAVAEVGKNFGMYARMTGANVTSASLGVLEAGKSFGKVASSGLLNLAGGGWGIAAIGAAGAKTLIDRQRDEKEQVAKESAAYNPLGVYNENIGRASSMKTLAGVLQQEQGNRARQDKTLSEAATITDEEFDLATRGGSKVLNSRLRGMGDDELLSFLRMNSMQLKDDPRLLSSVVSDVARVTKDQTRTQEILNKFAENQTPTQDDYNVASAQYERLVSQAQGGSGWWTRNFGYGSSKGLAEVISGQVNTINDSAARRQEFAGGDAGAAYSAMEYRKLIGSLPGVDNEGFSAKTADVLAGGGSLGILGLFGGSRPGDAASTDPLGSDRFGRITGMNSAIWTPVWDKEAKAVNASWQTFFQKMEDQYLGGKRIGASYQQMADFATSKYGEENVGKMFADPEQRAKIVAEYLRSDVNGIGKQGGSALADQMFGKFAGFSDFELENLIKEQLANPNPQEDSTFGLMYRGAQDAYGDKGAEASKRFMLSDEFKDAQKNEGDPNKQFIARNQMVSMARSFTGGDTTQAIDFIMKQIQNVPETKAYEIGQAAVADLNRIRGLEQSGMAQGFGLQADPNAQTRMGMAVQRYNLAQTSTGAGAEVEKQAALEELQNTEASYTTYLRNIALQQREFAVSMERGEEDFNISRTRSREAFQRSVQRSEEDFYRQRKWQQEDFNLSMKRMIEDFSKTAYNPFQRTDAKYTWSAEGLATNVQRQTQDLENQTKNLNKLSGMGISKEVISQLGLADPQNAQQLARMVEELANNPALVETFNKALSARVDAAGDLLSSGYVDTYNRTVADFEKGVDRASIAFRTAQKRASQEFGITMGQMADDYNRSVQRAKDDVIRANTEIGGNLGQMLDAATTALGKNLGSAGDQLIAKLKDIKKQFPTLFGEQIDEASSPGRAGSKGTARSSGAENIGVSKGQDYSKRIPHAYGGEIKPWETYVTGEKGPELVTGVSGHIMPASSFQTSTAREVVQMLRVSGFASPVSYKGGGSTVVDQSTKIVGGHFTVQTQDPDEMGRKLRGKERLDRLRSPKPTPISS